MSQQQVSIQAKDGVCKAWVLTPDGKDPRPGVVFYMDAFGIRPAMIEMAEHLAGMGYVAFLPEMYYRNGPYEPFQIDTVFTDPGERARLGALAGGLTKAMAASDTGAFLEFFSKRPVVAGTKVGSTGYCMGGALSLTAAAHHPDRIAAAASFHGGRLAVGGDPSSPHLAADRITATVYVAGATDDGSFTPEQAELLESALTEAGVNHTLEIYPGRHGFAVPDNPTYDAEADARHWEVLHELYEAQL